MFDRMGSFQMIDSDMVLVLTLVRIEADGYDIREMTQDSVEIYVRSAIDDLKFAEGVVYRNRPKSLREAPKHD
jgi:hypothetical protein